MLLRVLRMRSYKYIPGVWIAVNKSGHKNLLSKGSNEIIHHSFFIKIMLPHFFCISDLESIYPLRYHYSISCKFIDNFGYIQFSSVLMTKYLLSLSKFSLPFFEFSASILKSSSFLRLY